jgi:hypothetical protein
MNQYKEKTCMICFKPDGTPSTVNHILGLCDKCQSLKDEEIQHRTCSIDFIRDPETYLDKEKAVTGEKSTSQQQFDKYFEGINDNTKISLQRFFHFGFEPREIGFALMLWATPTWCVSVHFLFWHIAFGRNFVIDLGPDADEENCIRCGQIFGSNYNCESCNTYAEAVKDVKNDNCCGCGLPLDKNGSCQPCIDFNENERHI